MELFKVFPLVLIIILSSPLSVEGEASDQGGEEGVYLSERDGFIHMKVWGTSREIGYLQGKYLAPLVERGMAAYAHLTELRYGMTWDRVRAHGVTYWPYVDEEYREEIEGMAEGAREGGARNPLGDPVDWIDILSYNAMWDIWWRYSYVQKRLPGTVISQDVPLHHCSAFVATGSATFDGGFVMGQNLWMPYFLVPAHAIFVDITPPKGRRILMEVTAGMIWSGTEWYINDAGLVAAETTLGVGPYQWGGTPSFLRIRKAVQYATTIDEFVTIMLENTNGAYCSDYLLADAKTNEVAILELGSEKWALRRTSDGFLGSCNYPWDEAVAEEMGAPQGWEHSCYPRYVRWQQLYEEYRGKIDCHLGMKFLGDHYDTVKNEVNPCSHTLCGHVENASGYPHGSMDAKVVNRSMAARMETWARYGHSCGQPFLKDVHAREHPEYAFPDLIDMIARPWTTFGAMDPFSATVLEPDGEPLSGAEVVLKSSYSNHSYRMLTDENGKVYHPALQRGEYTLVVRGPAGEYEMSITVDGEVNMMVRVPSMGREAITRGVVSLIAVVVVASLTLTVLLKKKYIGAFLLHRKVKVK